MARTTKAGVYQVSVGVRANPTNGATTAWSSYKHTELPGATGEVRFMASDTRVSAWVTMQRPTHADIESMAEELKKGILAYIDEEISKFQHMRNTVADINLQSAPQIRKEKAQ